MGGWMGEGAVGVHALIQGSERKRPPEWRKWRLGMWAGCSDWCYRRRRRRSLDPPPSLPPPKNRKHPGEKNRLLGQTGRL